MSTEFETPEAPAARLRQLGDYILLEEIGRGGMGMVYRARQISMERHVALKVLPSFAGLDPESVARFQREAEAAGRLSHPGIVPIYAVGNVDGTYYYVMELVEGPSLFQLLEGLQGTEPQDLRHTLAEETAMAAIYPNLQETPVPAFLAGSAYPASCAALIMEVAGALTAAHQGKVIHRDLKPSNILVHPAGRPVLVDFGLARDELAFSMTQTGDAVGTPSYMAPEQAAGSRNVDARVDVYGLGATLYEMLTLRPPFCGNHSAEVMQAILDEDPIPPRRINPRVPKALDIIVLTCLAKDPEQRYASAADLSADLRAFLAGGVIQARRPGMFEVLARRLQRHRRSVYVAMMAVMAALLVGLLVGLVILNSSRQAGRLALHNAKVLLLEGRPRESHAAYVQALVLLEDQKMVAETRLQSFREVFPVMYGKRRFEVLRSFMDTLPPEELDQPAYHEFRRRLLGMGRLRIDTGAVRHAKFSVRGVENGDCEPDWRRLPVDGGLSIGRYLVRIEAPGMAGLVRAAQIERDQTVLMRPELRPLGTLPSGMCLVDPADQASFAVDRQEYSIAQYAEFLRSIEDRDLAAEMVPLDFLKEGRAALPISGLSHRQARIAAQLMGRHLMSKEEYIQAGSAGLPGLQFPWGRQFDVTRVVGDPRYSSEPLPGNSRPRGASPGGILHLVGNLAEPLSAGGGQPILAAGGNYLSEPRDLTLRSFVSRRDVTEQDASVGLRLACFLAPADDLEAAQALRQRLRGLAAANQPYIANLWRVQADGAVELAQHLSLAVSAGSLVFPTLTGFVDRQDLVARDANGRPLSWQPLSEEGELRGYRVELPKTGSGVVGLQVQRHLEAITGLHGDGDWYWMRVPLTTRAANAVDSLSLPPGCRVEKVWPAPDASYTEAGAPVLVWHRGLEGCRSRHSSVAIVQFRRDGTLTPRLQALAPVREFVETVFAALAERDADGLAPLLAADCRVGPGGVRRAALLANSGAWDSYTDLEVRDVTGVGEHLTVDLRVTWRPASLLHAQAVATRWPMRMILRRVGRGMQVVRLMPSTRFDLGRIDAREYRHAGLELRVRPPDGVRMQRTADALVELQVELRPGESDSSRTMMLLGCMGDVSQSVSGLRMRLTATLSAGGRGERLSENQVERFGAAGQAALVGNSEQWLFEEFDGSGWRSERWTFLVLGRRQFLIRSIGRGATRDAAQQAFRAARPWFRGITDALQID